jgi:hypothetical protein
VDGKGDVGGGVEAVMVLDRMVQAGCIILFLGIILQVE